MHSSSQRQTIFHFHLFKNAGTSIDVNLQRIFGDNFLAVELGGPADLFPAQDLFEVLESRPEIRAVSSHTMVLPVPPREGWQILPIIFLRHPLDRILSIYMYERAQESDSPGAILAKKWEFPDYVAGRLSSPQDLILRNWQSRWLARDRVDVSHISSDDEALFETASRVIADFPFIGVVERFSESLHFLNSICAQRSIPATFRVEKENRSSNAEKSLSERLKMIREMIGDELFFELQQANSLDMRLHRLAIETLERRLASTQ